MRLSISSTTGSRFELSAHPGETVEVVRRRLSQKLRVPKERFVLLHKEARLSKGKLQDLGIVDGSILMLVPTIEAGLLTQPSGTEQTIMQALESLTETQVSDFLSGCSPLTLALGVGDHLMFVHLQLAPQNVAGQQQRHLIARSAGMAGVEQVHPVKCGSTRFPHPSPAHLSSNPTASGEKASPLTSYVTYPSHSPSATLRSTHPPCSSPGPQSPTPAPTFPEGDCSVAGTPTSKKPAAREPGAVIESFVSHAPGVFSGTFSGTLPPAGQDSTSSSRQGINTILQILNDLLSATRHHQGAPLSLSQLRCPPPSTPTSSTPSTPTSPSPPPSPLTPDPVTTATSGPLMDHVSQGQSRSYKPTADQCFSQSKENQALRCKLERLQILMHQRRLHRWARRDIRTSHPYYSPYHRQPWSPGRRKANTRRHSNSNMSSRMALPWSCHGNPSCPPTL